jgi:sugar lactone lactonase YvrE
MKGSIETHTYRSLSHSVSFSIPFDTIFANDLHLFIAVFLPNIPSNARWAQNGITVAGGHNKGNSLNELWGPRGLYVDEDQTIYIADCDNHRIVEWKSDAANGRVVAGADGKGNQTDQLNHPTDVIIDKETDNLVICDSENRRVMRYSRQNGTTNGETIIENIRCYGLAMDDRKFLYVSDTEKHEVRLYKRGETLGTVVAGGNGKGDRLNQLNWPTYLFLDQDYSVYVSDNSNHRVVKWEKHAKEGIVVAGGRGKGNGLTQLNEPRGVFVDLLGTVYVAEWGNHRVTRWPKGVTQGQVIVGGIGYGVQENQLIGPEDLSFDQHGNLYVADYGNHRIQLFLIEGID